MDNIKTCFIIALKYYRDKPTHIKEYVNNINKFYTYSFILIVNNNSEFIEDIQFDYKNVIIITNTTDCKFELGAYIFGIKYILKTNIADNFNYFVFTQDTFILHNKYDFNNLLEQEVTACPIVTSSPGTFSQDLKDCMVHHRTHKNRYLIKFIIMRLGLTDSIPELTFCFANSFILEKSKLNKFIELTEYIKITNKVQSESSERFLAGVLYLLNNRKNTSIEKKIVNNFMNDILVGNSIYFEYFVKFIYGKK